MIFNGWDVKATALSPLELTPGIGSMGATGVGVSIAPHTDGHVWTWTVPPGVEAITFRLFGAMGMEIGPSGSPGPDDVSIPIIHSRRWPVLAGDEIVIAAGGEPLATIYWYPSLSTSPIRGGAGYEGGGYVGGAGGGASAIWINGDLVALSPGGGGWGHAPGPGPFDKPPSIYPIGSPGSVSNGADGTPDQAGGGGGGAPGGAAGTSTGAHGDNGASVPVDTDGGGPVSPTWEEIGLDPETDRPPNGVGAVGIWFYLAPPTAGGWSIDVTEF